VAADAVYRRTDAALEREATRLRTTFENGNRKDVMARLADLPPLEAVAIALLMAENEGMGGYHAILDLLSAVLAGIEHRRVR
jgi:hypothetical protein